MTLQTNKSTGDTITPAEYNEIATASNKVTDQTLVAADISNFDTEVSNNTTVSGKFNTTGGQFTGLVGVDSEHDNGSSGSAATINFNNGNYQKITLDQASTFTFTAPSAGVATIQLRISGGDVNAITWPTVTWYTSTGTAPTLDGNDLVVLQYDGTNYYGGILNQS